jgi:hypothetical protein
VCAEYSSAASGGEIEEGEAEPPPVGAGPAFAKGITAPERHFKGSNVMSTAGSCTSNERYNDGDYSVTYADGEPQTVSAHQIWDRLSADWPDWDYDANVHRLSKGHAPEPIQRMPLLAKGNQAEITMDIIEPEANLYGDGEGASSKPATRSSAKHKANIACMLTGISDQLLMSDQERSAHQPANKGMAAIIRLPEGTNMAPTLDECREMDAYDVEKILPRHWHQTKGHPFEPHLREMEVKELQDCSNRNVFGAPFTITPDMTVIGLMWVYAVKTDTATSRFKSFRARITLLGNQERHTLDRLTAYAPVAQMHTARLLAKGFQMIHEERCCLCSRGEDGSYSKLCYHVDDNFIIAYGEKYYASYLMVLATKFDYTEGPIQSHQLGVGYHVDHIKGEAIIEQTAQIWKFIKEFDYQDCKPAKAPAMVGPPPCEANCDEPYEGEWNMEAFIGHANYIHMCTRPDIGQVLKILSRFTKKFGKRHVEYAKHLLRYLRGTADKGLVYRTGYPMYYQIFADARHASCVDTRRSIVPIVVKLAGNTVFWKNMYTKIVSHSSTESELMALDVGATIGEMMRWLIESTRSPLQGRFVDKQGTISISSNPIQSGRNLHVHARYSYVRDLVYDGLFVIDHLITELQIADIGCTFKGVASFLEGLPARVRSYPAGRERRGKLGAIGMRS